MVTKVEIAEIKAEPIKIDSVVEPPVVEKKNKFLFVVGSVVALLIVIGTGVLGWFYINQNNNKETTVAVSPTPTPEITVAETIVLEKDKIVFEVFNATNIKGEAKKYKDKLEKLGFKVEKIGNENGIFKGIVVLIPKEWEKQKDLLITEIKKEIPSVTSGGENKESTTKVKLIIGN